MQLIPIENIFSNRDSIRKAREAFLIQKGSEQLIPMVWTSAKNLLLFTFIM